MTMEGQLRPPEEPWRQRRSSVSMLQESSLTAVTNIVSTEDYSRKIFKTIVLLTCLTGFLYQAITFFTYYFEYPTIVDIDIEKPMMTEMPGFTFCDNNGINKKRFCSEYPEECYVADESLCSKYPSYCEANKTLVPKESAFDRIDNMTKEEFLKVGNVIELSLQNMTAFTNVSLKGPFIRAKSYTGRGRMGCYSWFTVFDTLNEPFAVERSSVIHMPVATLTFNLHRDDQFIPGQKTGIYFSLHSPHIADNPADNGIFMKLGKVYRIYVSMEKEILLPHPYETACVNYTDIWRSRNKTGPRTQEMCQHKCMLDTTSKFLNCSAILTLYPHNLRICDFEEIMIHRHVLVADGTECITQCKDDCAKTKYIQIVKERFISELSRSEAEYEYESKLIKIEIYVDDSEIVTFRHRPQYLYIEAFSYVGGFIGIWLGISLIQLTDFIETLFRILRYSYKHKNDTQNE